MVWVLWEWECEHRNEISEFARLTLWDFMSYKVESFFNCSIPIIEVFTYLLPPYLLPHSILVSLCRGEGNTHTQNVKGSCGRRQVLTIMRCHPVALQSGHHTANVEGRSTCLAYLVASFHIYVLWFTYFLTLFLWLKFYD
jgi:hypothetical protein